MACWERKYLLDPVGEILLVVYKFEDRNLRFARMCVSQDREAVAVATNGQVLRQAAV